MAARASRVPFHVAAPRASIDWTSLDGVAEIDIEERDFAEATHRVGRLDDGGVPAAS
jgi:methylthioribose-1-phosphate isomerase